MTQARPIRATILLGPRPRDWFEDGQQAQPKARRDDGVLLATLGERLAFFPWDRNCWQPFCRYVEPRRETAWGRAEPRQGGL